MRAVLFALAALAACFAAPVSAAPRDPEPFVMAPGKAYILFRKPGDKMYYGLLMVRALSAEEQARYLAARDDAFARWRAKPDPKRPFRFDYKGPANLVAQDWGTRIDKGEFDTFLMPVEPGQYVVLGLSFGNYAGTCVCMGTVRFEAKAGVITDMGTIEVQNALDPLKFESLKDYVGWPVRGLIAQPPPLAMTVRPALAGAPAPARIVGQPIVPADYHAVAKMPNYLNTRVIRMAPVAGILGYDGDRAIDLRTGAAAR